MRKLLLKFSPLTQADQIRSPLLIAQGGSGSSVVKQLSCSPMLIFDIRAAHFFYSSVMQQPLVLYAGKNDPRAPSLAHFFCSFAVRQQTCSLYAGNDPRVPRTEAEQIRDKVSATLSPEEVWYILAKNEGHGFAKKENIDFYQEASVLFWMKYLLN
jgi:dipeptidyl aminopeptidase/acylaminoacyl peptidase